LENLDAFRDRGHAWDYEQAMWLMLQQDQAEDLVIRIGKQHSVQELADVAVPYLGQNYRYYVKFDPQLLRSVDVKTQLGDAAEARQQLGCSSTCALRGPVHEMVDADDRLLKESKHSV